jgi:hypothetical protein
LITDDPDDGPHDPSMLITTPPDGRLLEDAYGVMDG